MYTDTIHLNYQTLLSNNKGQYEYVTKAYDEGVTAVEYFQGLANYMDASRWEGLVSGGAR